MNRFALATLLALAATGAQAAPSLKGDITVTAAIVTVGDMFDNAGPLAETALFRAPAPGTTGIVPLAAVEQAAAGIGLSDFENVGFTRVRVARAATVVDNALLGDLIAADLRTQGFVTGEMQATARFDVASIAINAEAISQPASLITLRYMPATGAFAARFSIAGIDKPVDITGSVQMTVPALRLIATHPAGTVLTEADFETAMVPLKVADAGAYASLDQLVGMELNRQSRAGMMLKASDVSTPTVVSRNTLVTAYVSAGGMKLTIRAQSLGTVSAGEIVDVLNLTTKKVLHGVARADGSVEILSGI
ncbi:MAG: flagellar basal body P-ring formation chaperone FlgA [Devosia sp.]